MIDTVHGTFPGDFCRVSKSKIRGPKVEIKPSLNRIHMCLQPGGSPPRDGVVRANSAVKDRVAGLENWGHSGDCTPAQPVIPKNISSGVQIVVTQNGQTLTPAAIAQYLGEPRVLAYSTGAQGDRKSTRLNSSHSSISYAVFCLKKKNE